MSTAEPREVIFGLPLKEREKVARELLESLDPYAPDPDVEDAWIEEIGERAEAIDRGEAQMFDGRSAMEQIRREIREGRRP